MKYKLLVRLSSELGVRGVGEKIGFKTLVAKMDEKRKEGDERRRTRDDGRKKTKEEGQGMKGTE